jgi:putative membrane protein
VPEAYLTPLARKAFNDAITRCETCSAAEIVVAVRGRAHGYLHVHLIIGMVAALATTAGLLYSPWPFPYWSFLVDPPLMGAIIGGAVGQFTAVRRWLTPPSVRARWVERDALATFAEKRVADTTGRTGILVYLALTERRCAVIADRGVRDVVPAEVWTAAVAAIQEVAAAGGDGPAMAREIERLGDCLEAALPRTGGDVNELPDELS